MTRGERAEDEHCERVARVFLDHDVDQATSERGGLCSLLAARIVSERADARRQALEEAARLKEFVEKWTTRRCENDHCWGGVDDLSRVDFVGGENICELHKARRVALLPLSSLCSEGSPATKEET